MKFTQFIIFGGRGFIGTHTKNLLKEKYPNANIYIADLLSKGTDFEPIVDVCYPISIEGEFGKDTLIFNFAAVHRIPGHPDHAYFETNIRGAENENADHIQLHNCCYYPSFNIEQITKTMLKATGMKRFVPFIPRKPMVAAATVCGLLGGLGLSICPARVKKLMVSTNINGQKLSKNYPLSYSLEDVFRDWYKDCGEKGLE